MSWLGNEIRDQLPKQQRLTFIDIGAHLGNVTNRLRDTFPSSRIHAIEPTPSTYDQLAARFEADPQVDTHQVAFDLARSQASFVGNQDSGNHLVTGVEKDAVDVIPVTCTYGDAFCKKYDLHSVDALKIDTEGNDLRVLAGFSEMLRTQSIQFIDVECTTNLDNRFHVHLERFIHFLHPFNYRVFSVYQFHRKIYKTNQQLNGAWFCNAVFVREVNRPRVRRIGEN